MRQKQSTSELYESQVVERALMAGWRATLSIRARRGELLEVTGGGIDWQHAAHTT